jgi:hypothetical protein
MLIHTVKMEDVKKIKFQKTPGATKTRETGTSSTQRIEIYPEFEEFRSTISLNSIGTGRHHFGLNYLHK